MGRDGRRNNSMDNFSKKMGSKLCRSDHLQDGFGFGLGFI